MLAAAIDLGTVTTRLLIANVAKGQAYTVHRRSIITHMGEGLDETGQISSAAIARVIAAVLAFREALTDARLDLLEQMEQSGQTSIPVCAIATSAMRDASNGMEVVEALHDLGIDVQVISGEREARLSYLGTMSGFGPGVSRSPVLVCDIGGGSTELIVGQGASILRARSFDMGSRRMTDRFSLGELPTGDQIAQAREWVMGELQPFFAPEAGAGPRAIVAVAGTATTTVAIREQMAYYDPDRIHKSVVEASELSAITDRLASLPIVERMKVPGLEAQRAEVIIGGLIILQSVLKASGLDCYTVSETDILQGAILDTFGNKR